MYNICLKLVVKLTHIFEIDKIEHLLIFNAVS